MTVVLDTSALIALVKAEPGASAVTSTLAETSRSELNHAALLSSVNLCELYEQLGEAAADELIAEPGVICVIPFTTAKLAAAMRPATRQLGLGLADRACLSLAKHHGIPVLTTDTAWAKADLGVRVQLIRNNDQIR